MFMLAYILKFNLATSTSFFFLFITTLFQYSYQDLVQMGKISFILFRQYDLIFFSLLYYYFFFERGLFIYLL